MMNAQKRYDHCVNDFLPGNPREDRDGCIRIKSGDLPVTLLHNTTTGYSQAMRIDFFPGISVSLFEIDVHHCIPTSRITPVMFICFFKIKHD